MRLILALTALLLPRAPRRRPIQTFPTSAGNRRRSKPSPAAWCIPGRSPSCPTAACWSPNGPAACASSRATANCRRRSPACRTCLARGQGGLLDVVARPRFRAKPHDLFLLRRAVRAAAAAPRWRARSSMPARRRGSIDVNVIYRQHGPRLARQSFRRPHRAGRRRQSVPHQSASTSPTATWRRRSTTISARSCASRPTARRRRTIHSSASPARGRKSGPTATAIRKASRSIRPTANCGSRSTAPWAATRSTSSRRARNYGWPLVSYGVNYDGTPVGTGKAHMAGMEDPVWHWTPSIAPSGMTFYTGDLFKGWKGSLFNGALKFQMLVAARAQGRQGREGRAPAARPARAHPRRAAGPGRRALSAHRQQCRPHPARGAGKIVSPLVKHEKRAGRDQREADALAPGQRLLEIDVRKDGEHQQA